MALLFMDGFDHYSWSDAARKKLDDPHPTGGAILVPGRFGGSAIAPSSGTSLLHRAWPGFSKTFGAKTTIILGCAVKLRAFDYSTHPFMSLIGNVDGKHQVQFWVDDQTGELKVGLAHPDWPKYFDGVDFDYLDFLPNWYGSTGWIPPIGLWFYFEVKIVASSAGVGSIEIHIDSEHLVTFTNINTLTAPNTAFHMVRHMAIGTPSGYQEVNAYYAIDDLYICDTAGTKNNDFLGEVRVQTRYPDAEGHQTDFYPATGTNNATMVNKTVTDWDVNNPDFVFSGNVGAIDLYSMQNFTSSGSIYGVQVNVIHRKDDVGNRRVAPMLRIGSTNYEGTDFPLYSDYTWAGTIFEENPFLEADWNLTDLNQAEFGLKITE